MSKYTRLDSTEVAPTATTNTTHTANTTNTTLTAAVTTLTRAAAADKDENAADDVNDDHHVDDDDDDDDDESYPMFVAHEHNRSNNNKNNNNNKHSKSNGHSKKRSASFNKSYYNNNNHNNNNNIITGSNYLIDHEQSMEVPLFNGTNNNNNNNNHHNHHHHLHHQQSDNFTDYEWQQQQQQLHHCRCKQPGFGASVTNDKSTQDAKIKIILAISLCGVFMIVEFLGGYLAGSLAIMTDAAHLASDCISFVIGLVSIWLGGRPPDIKMSFGYKRTEVMGALVSIFSIWILTATLVVVAVQRLYSNDYDLDAETMMIISGIGILINIVMAHILHGSSLLPAGMSVGASHHGHSHAHAHAHDHAHTHNHAASHLTEVQSLANREIDDASTAAPVFVDGSEGSCSGSDEQLQHRKNSLKHKEKNLNLRAAMIHVIGDLVQSVGVFIAAIVIKFYPSAKFMDPLCTILFSFIVLLTTVGLFKESVRILSDAIPPDVSITSLEIDLSQIEGVKAVHHLNVWNHTANFNVMMVHLVIDFLSDSNTILDRATLLAQNSYNIKHSTIQIERLTS